MNGAVNYQLEPAPGRVPPSDLDAEAAVLSACLLDPESLDVVREILTPAEMYAGANNRILDAAYLLQDQKRAVDLVSVAGYLRDKGRLDEIGGTPYLAQLTDAIPAVANVASHATRIKEKARLRAIISACQRIAAEGYGDVGDVAEWAENSEKNVILAAADSSDKEKTWSSYGDAARKVYSIVAEAGRTGATMIGYPTGFDEMDNHVGGMAAGDLWIVGGYPGIGKTSWVKQATENIALQRTKKGARVGVIFFSLEMKYDQLMLRSMSRRSSLPFSNVRIGRLFADQWQTLMRECTDAREVAMILDEGSDLTPFRMRRLLRLHLAQLRADHGADTQLGAVVVDYIQLMTANNPSNNRASDLGTISKQLKQIAKEFKCSVIALSSLNRPDNKSKVKAPGMSALRESGALEFDADVILMIHREDHFREPHEAKDNLAELLIVKGRNSGNSRHEVQFDGRYTAFYPLTAELFPRNPPPAEEYDARYP